MILILSYDEWDSESEHVSRWLRKLNGDFIRLNANDFIDQSGRFTYTFDNSNAEFVLNGKAINFEEITTVWLRRWGNPSSVFSDQLGGRNQNTLNTFLDREWETLTQYLFYLLRDKKWITPPAALTDNKLISLVQAEMSGLQIPQFTVTNSKDRMQKFASKSKSVTKVLSNFQYVMLEDEVASVFTEELDTMRIRELPEYFYPSLIQERIDKRYEVRVFCLGGDFYATAVVPTGQNSEVDIKKAIKKEGISNRYMPYRLPLELEFQLRDFLNHTGYDTCSIDLMRATDGTYYFIEVNPIGKFMFYSQCCNYNLEKLVAEYLLIEDGQRNQAKID